MATVAEKFRGVRGDQQSRQIEFVVKDATDAGDAIGSTLLYLGSNYPGLTTDGIPLQNIAVEEVADHLGLFKTTASFSITQGEEPETNDITTSFNVNLDTRRIYRSYSTASYKTAPGVSHKETHNKIDMDEDDKAQGADVRVPVGGFQVSWYAPQASVTQSYRTTVLGMVGKVNNNTFYGFDRGEVLFAGVAGSARNADDWELTFQFETRENETGITVGESPNEITGIDIEGWQLMWVRYLTQPNPGKTDNIQVPQEAYIEQIYQYADFSQLGIGT
jgi:hypothetical protein